MATGSVVQRYVHFTFHLGFSLVQRFLGLQRIVPARPIVFQRKRDLFSFPFDSVAQILSHYPLSSLPPHRGLGVLGAQVPNIDLAVV